MTRRQFEAAALATVLTASVEARATSEVIARQAPAHYRLSVDGLRITALCDGYLNLAHTLFPAATEQHASELAHAAFLTPGPLPTAVNAFAVEAGGRLILIDAGVGPSRGDTLGRLPAEMRAAGLDPALVAAVLLTHLHTDHCGGLLDADGQPVFPNAEILVAEPEWQFWSDPGLAARAPAAMRPMISVANQALGAYRQRITRFMPGTEPIPGIRSVALAGHTPGHTGFILGSSNDAVFIWADIIHVASYQFPHPEWGLSFDVDQTAAADMRARTFAQVAGDRLRVAGMHLAFPGIGHVVRDGAGFRYLAEDWRPLR
ncbi:MAG: MBL fold metallo-hydrolase [Tardiphaga sp.]|nr:MBL fold metallo-hydrolase [Tardiphaga sp.]